MTSQRTYSKDRIIRLVIASSQCWHIFGPLHEFLECRSRLSFLLNDFPHFLVHVNILLSEVSTVVVILA